jgi:hypothetical protein
MQTDERELTRLEQSEKDCETLQNIIWQLQSLQSSSTTEGEVRQLLIHIGRKIERRLTDDNSW